MNLRGAIVGLLLSALLASPTLEAKTNAEGAGAGQPQTVKELLHEGLNQLMLEQTQKAEETFLKAKTLDPYSEEAHNFLGLLYLQQGLYQKAEDMLQRAVAIEPLYVDALRNLGKLYLQQEKFGEATSFLRRAFTLDRSQAHTAYLLGMASYFSGQPDKAIEAYESAFAADPNLPAEAHYNLGVVYHESGRFLDAIREYEAVLKSEPEHLNAMNNLGLVFSLVGEKERAIDLFNRVLKIDKDNVKARINLGNVYLNTKDLVEAEKIYRSAITLDGSDISSRLNLGVVYFERGEFDKARGEWENLLASDPKNLKVLSVMASAYLEKKQYERAIEIFQQLVDLMPNNGSLANTLGYLLADQNRELPKARKLIERALELDPANRGTYLDSLAWVLYRQGQFSEARQAQDQAIKVFQLSHEPVSSEVHLHMGRIREKLKDTEGAILSYKAAITSNTDPEMVKLASESLELLSRQ